MLKEFVMRGNVLDMAVGVIIGGAFGKIVTSLVNDILMPPLGLLIGSSGRVPVPPEKRFLINSYQSKKRENKDECFKNRSERISR